MNVTTTLFHGTAGWMVGILALIGAVEVYGSLASSALRPLRLYTAGRWYRLRIGRRPLWVRCMVTLPDGTRGVVAEIYPAVFGHPRRVLIEETDRFSAPQAIVARASDCTRVPRKGFLYICRSLRQAIREFPSTTSKDA
jgi:hypothetical protein